MKGKLNKVCYHGNHRLIIILTHCPLFMLRPRKTGDSATPNHIQQNKASGS